MSMSGGAFQFFGGRMTSRGQCPRGVLVNVFLQEILYPRLQSTDYRGGSRNSLKGGGGYGSGFFEGGGGLGSRSVGIFIY